ncbi:MAG: DUF4157 domain-containing protein [Lachnospiraceae bacterium]|nr:DUF4157 domain-containing protein [Lachnospiraceae bacterium]
MPKKLLENAAAEKEANDVGMRYMNSTDVMKDMRRDYGSAMDGIRVHDDSIANAKVTEAGRDGIASGKDIYMRAGSLSSHAPEVNGLLAHEVTHVMQQSNSADQSVEYGSEQGGLFDWFRSLFGRKKREDEMAPATEQDQSMAAASLAHMQSDGRSGEGDDYLGRKFGQGSHGALTDSHTFRLFLRQSYGKSDEEKDELYDMYTNPARREDYLAHVKGLVNTSMKMNMNQFNLQGRDALLQGADRVNDAATDIMALSDVVKDNAAELGYSDKFVSEDFGSRRQYLMATKANTRGRLRELTGEAAMGSTAQMPSSQTAFGKTGINQGFRAFKRRYINANRADRKKQAKWHAQQNTN